jgi:uncharacterized membrane protein YhaH (DUF805 family)
MHQRSKGTAMAFDLNREIAQFDVKQWLSFQGRIGRQTWWLRYVLLLFCINVAVQVAAWVVSVVDFTGLFAWLFALVGFLVVLALLWPSLAGGVKRLHDRDMSGWWLLIGLVPFVGGIALLVLLGFLRGTPGPNRFGPDPLGGSPIVGAHDQATVISPRR